ncbi:MAG: 50S ribosomal protein L16 [Nanoarchaeota archaeon]
MARMRKFCSYRARDRPYTRISSKRERSFIRMTHNTKIIRFQMGSATKQFDHTLNLVSKIDLQIRDNAIESARTTSNRVLESTLGQGNYFLRLRPYPHQVLRENPIASGAGADRFSTGMKKSFGKPIGQAMRIKKGSIIFEVCVNENGLLTARKALRQAATKLPCSTSIIVAK